MAGYVAALIATEAWTGHRPLLRTGIVTALTIIVIVVAARHTRDDRRLRRVGKN